MPILPITHQSWLFTPPLDMPLQLRMENGRFDSLRHRPLSFVPTCATNHVIAADDPENPTEHVVHFADGIHQAVDLASVAGNCVYSAYGGQVVRVETDPAQTRGTVTIDHHPSGLGFVTQYIHITDIRVSVGEHVNAGEPIAAISARPENPTLHFELWAVVDPNSPPVDTNLVPIDPTRALYAWEQRLVADEPLAGPLVPLVVGITRIHTVAFFYARFDGEVILHIPMYEPMTEDERLTIGLLREAHRRGLAVQSSLRHSGFWGLDVATQVELA